MLRKIKKLISVFILECDECFRADASPVDSIGSGIVAENNGLSEYGKVSLQFISVNL
jgi:hypothetical protein